jgi:hypothetical protein
MEIERRELIAVVPGDVVEHAVAADAHLTSRRCCAGVHEVEKVPAAWFDRLAQENQAAHLDDKPGLLEQLARCGLDQRLSSLHSPAGEEPVPMAVLHVFGEEDTFALAEAHRDPHPDGGVAHCRIITAAGRC